MKRLNPLPPHAPIAELAADPVVGAPAPHIYRAGTLQYTLRGVAVVFFWMLLGDFCFTLMETVFPTVLSLKLKGLHADNATIGLLVASIPNAMIVVITPIVSYRSDRHRGRLGRRIPYLLWPTPFITLFLIAVGFSDSLGRWFYHSLVAVTAHLSETTVILWTIGLCVVLFECFNLFVASVYYYLFNDVVPQELMGRFYGLFRVVAAGAAFVFNFFLLAYAGTPIAQRWIFVSAGLAYLVAFGLMCWRVKEGQYPPPVEHPAHTNKARQLLTGIRTYCYECFSLPYYWWFYLGTTAYTVGMSIMTFQIFFAHDALKMSLGEFGKVLALGSLLALLLNYPLGWLSDKLHAVRMNVIVVFLTVLILLACGWSIQGQVSFWIWVPLLSILTIAYAASSNPMYPQVLPKEQFGQFASAQALIRSGAVMFAGYGGGMFLDWMGRFNPGDKYRGIYWWAAAFMAVSLVFMLLFYRGWKCYGGGVHYKAPVRVPGVGVILEAHDEPFKD